MATDKNKFDTFLKQNLIRDLLFRGLIWGAISLFAAYWSIHHLDINPLSYMDRMGGSLGGLLNRIGTFSILICVPALMFKDLEVRLQSLIWKERMRGCLAGFIRRLAGDLTLWTLGATLTILTSLLVVTWQAGNTWKDYAVAATFSASLIIMILAVGFFNIQVRREAESYLANHIKNPKYLVAIYAFASVLLLTILYFSPING